LKKAREIGVKTPRVFNYDGRHFAIYMEEISFPQTKEVILENYDAKNGRYKDDNLKEMVLKMGESIARLHANDLIHGDLTTSNVLYSPKDKEITMIDFGLSSKSAKYEDKAVDLYVLERAFISTHPNSEHMMEELLGAYKKGYGDEKIVGKVLKRLEAVRMRGRKRSMVG